MEISFGRKKVKAAGADGHDPPAGDHDLLGHDAPADVLRPRGAGREQEAQGDARRRPRGHRVRPLLLRGARQAPEGLQPALRRHGARRRGRRRARGGARADRRPAREGRQPAPPGQVRDGLPDRRARVRARRAARADRVHRPRVRRGLQGVRRRAADDHQVHRRHVALRDRLLVPAADRLHRRRRSPSRSGATPAGAARSGTGSASASRQDRPDRRRRSRSRAGRARSPPSTPPACRSCRRSR